MYIFKLKIKITHPGTKVCLELCHDWINDLVGYKYLVVAMFILVCTNTLNIGSANMYLALGVHLVFAFQIANQMDLI